MKLFFRLSLCSALLFSIALYAQQIPVADQKKEPQKEDPMAEKLREREEKKKEVKVSGKINASFTQELQKSDKSDNNDNYGSFAVDRAYVTLRKKIDSIFSIRVTADVERAEDIGITSSAGTDPHTHEVTATGNPYEFFLKYAYIQAKPVFKSVYLQFRLGMIDTPIIGVTEKMSDYRWVSRDFIQNSAAIVGGSGLHDPAADLGFSTKLNLGNKVDFVFAVTNGEGYQHAFNNINSGYAYYGLVSITPIQEIFINGFLRIENEESSNSDITPRDYDSSVYYFGAGLGLKTKLIKAGFNILTGKRENKDPAFGNNKYLLFDSWLNVNLDGLFQKMIPVLLTGRFAYGEDSTSDGSSAKVYGIGLGYQCNNHIRLLCYYEQYNYDAPGMRDSVTLSVKSEGRF